MPYNFVADSFHTKKLCSRLSQAKCDFTLKKGRFAFLTSPFAILGSLESSYSGLHISVNWTFFARYYGSGATSEYRFKIGDFAPTWAG